MSNSAQSVNVPRGAIVIFPLEKSGGAIARGPFEIGKNHDVPNELKDAFIKEGYVAVVAKPGEALEFEPTNRLKEDTFDLMRDILKKTAADAAAAKAKAAAAVAAAPVAASVTTPKAG